MGSEQSRTSAQCLVVLGTLNAGLGFSLTGVGLSTAPVGAVIAYSVVAGIIGLGYTLTVLNLPLIKRRVSSY